MRPPGPSVLCWLALLPTSVERSIREESKSFLVRFPLEYLQTGVTQYHGFEVTWVEVAIRPGEVGRAVLSFNFAGTEAVALPGALFELTLGPTVVGLGLVVGPTQAGDLPLGL